MLILVPQVPSKIILQVYIYTHTHVCMYINIFMLFRSDCIKLIFVVVVV